MLVDSNLDGALSFEELSKILGNIKVRQLDFCHFGARSAWIYWSKGSLDSSRRLFVFLSSFCGEL